MISPYFGQTFVPIAQSLTVRELLNTSEASKAWNLQANQQEIWDFYLYRMNIERGQGLSKEIYVNHVTKFTNGLKLSRLFQRKVTTLHYKEANIVQLKSVKNILIIKKSSFYSRVSDVAILEEDYRPLPTHQNILQTSCILIQESQIISGTEEGLIVIRKLDSCEHVADIIGHSSKITLFKKLGENTISGSDTGTVKLWNFASFQCIAAFDNECKSEVTALLGDEHKLIIGFANGQIKIWNTINPFLRATLEKHTGGIIKMLFYQDTLISGSKDSTINIWDLKRNELIHTFEGHTQEITCLKQKYALLFSGSKDATIKIWDLATKTLRQTLEMHTSPIIGIKLRLDCLIAGSANKFTVSVKNEEGLYTNPKTHSGVTPHPKSMKDFVITENDELISCTARTIITWEPEVAFFG